MARKHDGISISPNGLLSRRGFIAGAAAFSALSAPTRVFAAPKIDKPLIVLDPGHGGHDPGAIGVTGLFEKHVALETALLLQTKIQHEGKYRVIVTRDEDAFIPLEDRTKFAEQHDARLFMSIHADAIHDAHVRGASVYTNSKKASDAEAAEVAQVENAADGGSSSYFDDVKPEVANILGDLMLRETHDWSLLLQKNTVKSLGAHVDLLKNPARHANFAVLRSPSIPAVLVEMAFMSNRSDERLLRTETFRHKIVDSLHTSLESCLKTIT